MDDIIYVVSVKVGQQMRFEFEGIMLSFDNESDVFTFGECTENYAPKKDGDVLVINLGKKSIAYGAQHFSIAMNILKKQQVGTNFYFTCATDLCKVDVFICEKSLWRDRGEAIFL